MIKRFKYILVLLVLCNAAFAQNIPTGALTPSATGVRQAPAAYTGVPINYLRTFAPRIPIDDSSTININSLVEQVQTAVVYTDSYGRTLETVAKQLSPAKKDNVSAPFYDDFGRPGSFSYLPFAAVSGNTADGYFKTNPFQQDSVFYKNLFPDEQVNYRQMLYDGSPLNIPVKGMAEGNEWGGAGRGKTLTHRSSTAADSVRYWSIGIATEDDLPATTAYNTVGSLNVQEITDESGVRNVTYKDIAGRTILTKTQVAASPAAGNSGWLCTYYVYDETGKLRLVIPPKAVEALAAGSWQMTVAIQQGLCYYYFYDSRGRQIMKSVPGKGKSYTAYDLLDRPVMTQDPNLRNTNQWAFVLYDGQSRPMKSGVITSSLIKDSVWAQAARSNAYPALSGTYTVMTESYYDNYDWTAATGGQVSSSLATTDINSTNFITSYNSSPDYAQQITGSLRIYGAVTGSKTLVLGTANTYLYAVPFYDNNGRTIQTQQKNYTGGTDVATVQYNFTGSVLRSHLSHAKAVTNPQTHTILTKYSYDHASRLLTLTKNTDNKGDKTIVTNNYMETGQLLTKVLGSNIETQQYSYNIRGMLTGINSGYAGTANSNAAFFGETLSYGHGFTAQQYNGGIAGVQWKTGGDGIARAYGYTYDKANRLTQADFTQQNSGSTAWTTDKADFTVSGLSYDGGGNILSEKQKGLTVGASPTIDSLSYTYFTNTNRLQKVADGAASYGLGDFKDSSNTNDDYSYDANGNIIQDNNRHLHNANGTVGTVFNLLDKPDSMAVAGKSCTYYTYDAGGTVLKKTVKDYVKNTVSTYLYVSGFVYRNDTLQYALHEEGRIRLKDSSGTMLAVYDYFIKDHAGNVRTLLTEENRQDNYPIATMDSTTAIANTEEAFYANLPQTRTVQPAGYPTDPYSVPNANTKVAMVQGNGNKTGPSITLKVMAGDKFNVRVSSYYKLNGTTPGTPVSPLTDIVNAMINGVSGSTLLNTHGVTQTQLQNGGAFSNVSDFLTNQSNNTTIGKPKAFLNWILFDEQFNYDSTSSGFMQVGADNVLTPITKSDMPISKSGYLYIYVSNETPNIPVYFDNLQVSHVRGKLLETNEYYPYGLQMKNISYRSATTMVNRYKNNGGNEYEDEGELNYSNTFYRKYDAQIGRFTGVDMLAEEFADVNPYQYGGNNPVMFNDPDGDLQVVALPEVLVTAVYHTSWATFLSVNSDFGNGGGGSGSGGGGGNGAYYSGGGQSGPGDGKRIDGKGNKLRGGPKKDRDRDLRKYPPEFQKWYDNPQNKKHYKLPGQPDPDLNEPFQDWLGLEKPRSFLDWNSIKQKVSNVTGLTGAALTLYLIVSEGSRLFPPRNLIPIP